jgi:hypothetical protein
MPANRSADHGMSAEQARAALAEHFGTFTLEPTAQVGKPVYSAHGKVDFFGEEAMARTGGAGARLNPFASARSPY